MRVVDAQTLNGTYNRASNIWFIGSMANGSCAVLTLTFEVIGNGTIRNNVVVESSENDTNGTNSTTVETNLTVKPVVDVEVTIRIDKAKVKKGDAVEFIVTVTNKGPSDAVKSV